MHAVVAPASQQPDATSAPQLRTLLLTDLVDSTGLVERLGDGPAAALFREHDALVLALQQRWRGRLIDRSDGLLLLFERAIDGLGFALDYARGLRELGAPRKVVLQARAGLHVGEVLTWRNSDEAVSVGAKPLEVEGLAKPLAGRLMSLARPGQILLSATAEPLARRAARELGERGEQLLWKSHGRWRLKGVPEAQELYEVGEAGLAPLRAPKAGPKAWRDIPLWRRPAALAAELLLAVGLATGAWFVTRPQPAIAFGERDWVVMGDLRNLTGQTVLDDSLQQAFRISLEQSRHVNVLSDLKARDTLARMQREPGTALDRAVASEIALRDGVRAVILPTVAEVGGRVRVSAEVIDPHTQTTVYAEFADGEGLDSVLASVDDVTAALRARLGEEIKAIERDSEPLPQVTTSNLDALRAYALGQQAFGSARYAEAKEFYARAANLDPKFALAYVGLVRAHNGLADLEGGLQYLRKAQALQERLPARDRLYVEAWLAQVDEPRAALEKWRHMSELYPDFFPATANVGNAHYMRHEYRAALPYALRSATQKNEFYRLSFDLIGRLRLGLEQTKDAEKAFSIAASAGMASAGVRLAATHAAGRNFRGAEAAWPDESKLGTVYFERLSMYLDQGKWRQAGNEAKSFESRLEAGSSRARVSKIAVATTYYVLGDLAAMQVELDDAKMSYLTALQTPSDQLSAQDDAYALTVGALLAQRAGNGEYAREVLAYFDRNNVRAESPPLKQLRTALEANQLRLEGDAQAAIAKLKPLVDGNEPFQAHVVLLEAYADAGEIDSALAEADWLGKRRGLSYSENGCAWCEQPLNVVDTTISHLRAAELLASGQRQKARKEIARFDRYWPMDQLPTHLRVRRDAVLATFN